MYCEYKVDAIKEIDVYYPLEEGLDVVEVENLVPTLRVFLSTSKKEEYEKKPGFMKNENFSLEKSEEFMGYLNKNFKSYSKKRGRGKYRGNYRGKNRG